MKIENLRKEVHDNSARVVATVIWETLKRPPVDLFFETSLDYAADLECNPNAFLTVCAIPAMRFGEERIAIDVPICPQLKEGLEIAMRCLISWYGKPRKVIPIEAPLQTEAPPPSKVRSACFFSGGVDALTMVYNNRQRYTRQHSASFKDAIVVYGILKDEIQCHEDPSYQHVMNAIEYLAKDADLNLIPVYTNAKTHLRDLDPKVKFWQLEFQSSFLAAVAHVFGSRFSSVSIASSFDFANEEPYGSHPFLDPQYSSNTLQIRHEDIMLSRLEKTQILGGWDAAIQHLRVCNIKSSYQHGNHNCGQCEKCMRTKMELLAAGLLDKADTFVDKRVSKKRLFEVAAQGKDPHVDACYSELVAPLRDIGRSDLANVIQRGRIIWYLKSVFKQWDQAHLQGRILGLSNQLRAAVK
jgi:hypothetical protein